jgi:multiple sugar transport system substrate-binding protein/sn-glycerol 3-phosphate transport system substrate-binding protein
MKIYRTLGLVLAIALVMSLAPIVSAQGDEFVATFDLPVEPTAEGELASVDPSGQTVTYWHQHSDEREEHLNSMIDEFNANNPWGITVEGSNQGGYGDIYQKMIAGIAAGEVPNLVVAYQNQSATYQLEDALTDMNVFVNDAQWGYNEAEQADFFQGFFNQDINPQFDNARLGFPPNRSMEALYVNMDALAELGYDAPPTSWTEFGEMACAWTESGEGRMGYSVRTDASFVASASFALGGDIFDYENDEYMINGEETVYALEFLQDLLDQGCANRIAEQYGDQNDFGRGVNMFYIGSTSGLPFVASAIAESEAGDFEWAIAPIPYADLGAEGPTQNVYGASLSIPKTTPEAELAAWLFVRWMSEPAQQASWAEMSNYFPVRASAAEGMADYLEANPQYNQAFQLLDSTKAEPPVAGYDVIRDMIEEQAFFAILDGADAQSTLDDLTDEANEIYQTQFQM